MEHSLFSLFLLLHLLCTISSVTALKKTLKKVRNAASDSVVLLGMEIMSQCLERKIILMLKLLSSNYYTAMYIAITWGLR